MVRRKQQSTTIPSTTAVLTKPVEMFKNQIPQWPDFARNQAYPSKPEMVKYDSETYPQPGDPAQGWGLSFFSLLRPGPTGRAAGTVWWSGVANLIWWADIENGVGGMIATQILPFGGELNVGAVFLHSLTLHQMTTSLTVTRRSRVSSTPHSSDNFCICHYIIESTTNLIFSSMPERPNTCCYAWRRFTSPPQAIVTTQRKSRPLWRLSHVSTSPEPRFYS